MPAKGVIYATINVDLAQWANDYMEKYRLSKSDLARRLRLNRGRIGQMLEGQLNTTHYLRQAVLNCEGGNWLSMSKYAKDKETQNYLELQDARAGLTEEEKELSQLLDLEVIRYTKTHNLRRLVDLIRRDSEQPSKE